jgi:hypothetical protein
MSSLNINYSENFYSKRAIFPYAYFAPYASKQVPGNVFNPKSQRLTNVIEDFLGKDFRIIKNADGDAIFVSKCHTKKIRFDIHDPHGYPAHGHAEIYDSVTGKWKDFGDQHMMYFSDSFDYVNKPNPPKPKN